MIPLAVIFVLHGCLGTKTDNNVKRLLLNDPDIIAERLTRLEGTVATLDTTVKQLTAENQQQQNHIQHLETALRDQHSKYVLCIVHSLKITIIKINHVRYLRLQKCYANKEPIIIVSVL